MDRLLSGQVILKMTKAGHNHHSLDFVRRKSEYYEALEKNLAEEAENTAS